MVGIMKRIVKILILVNVIFLAISAVLNDNSRNSNNKDNYNNDDSYQELLKYSISKGKENMNLLNSRINSYYRFYLNSLLKIVKVNEDKSDNNGNNVNSDSNGSSDSNSIYINYKCLVNTIHLDPISGSTKSILSNNSSKFPQFGYSYIIPANRLLCNSELKSKIEESNKNNNTNTNNLSNLPNLNSSTYTIMTNIIGDLKKEILSNIDLLEFRNFSKKLIQEIEFSVILAYYDKELNIDNGNKDLYELKQLVEVLPFTYYNLLTIPNHEIKFLISKLNFIFSGKRNFSKLIIIKDAIFKAIKDISKESNIESKRIIYYLFSILKYNIRIDNNTNNTNSTNNRKNNNSKNSDVKDTCLVESMLFCRHYSANNTNTKRNTKIGYLNSHLISDKYEAAIPRYLFYNNQGDLEHSEEYFLETAYKDFDAIESLLLRGEIVSSSYEYNYKTIDLDEKAKAVNILKDIKASLININDPSSNFYTSSDYNEIIKEIYGSSSNSNSGTYKDSNEIKDIKEFAYNIRKKSLLFLESVLISLSTSTNDSI